MRKQNKLIIFAVFLSVIFGLQTVVRSYSLPHQKEIRGVWLTNVDSDILFSTQGIQSALNRLDNIHFNTVYPTVWQGGYSLYPSAVTEQVFGQRIDPDPRLEDRDVLQEVLKKGHQLDMTVIPWFEFGFMQLVDSPLVKQHPEWLTQRRDGTIVEVKGEDEVVWLNPFHPAVQEFILDLITEIVTQYDVDGIQFDDHFGLPVAFGYDDYTTQLYQQDVNLSPPEQARETFWVRWRADQLNEFMGKVFHTIKAANPDCIVSVSPNPLHFALPAHLQDWLTWEQKGYMEELVLQVYRTDMERFIDELQRTEVQLANSHIPVAIGILSGLKNRPTPMPMIKQQVKEVRDRGFDGVSFFFYESLWKWAEQSPLERERAIYDLFLFPASREVLIGQDDS
ncbi:glycoside hydrolase family 10 protein [Halothece sp. PCC 7418]|uniref:glycoside hydrolase family 10 protein n=1 Tax=Halothece sp. (strain PCC 7418) TaxID=65093 RepID=UPI0003071C19|nr:family 10 glycosylhydrolase [Halothece sp. PCC 7418]